MNKHQQKLLLSRIARVFIIILLLAFFVYGFLINTWLYEIPVLAYMGMLALFSTIVIQIVEFNKVILE
jgi:hypothetical protein